MKRKKEIKKRIASLQAAKLAYTGKSGHMIRYAINKGIKELEWVLE